MNKKTAILVAIAIVIASGAFYGGLIYAKTKTSNRGTVLGQNFQNLTPEQRQQFAQNGGFIRTGSRGANGAGFIGGEIISKDDKSITVKAQDGSTKIIFLADSTVVTKTTDGTKDDLVTGKQVVITGTSNSDGSVTAQNVQIRPNLPRNNSN